MSKNTEQIRALHELFVEGIITEDEFNVKKKKLLNTSEDHQRSGVSENLDSKNVTYENSSNANWILYGVPIFLFVIFLFFILVGKSEKSIHSNAQYSKGYSNKEQNEEIVRIMETQKTNNSEQVSIDAYRNGYRDGSTGYGLSPSETVTAEEYYIARGYNYSEADLQVYKMGYYDGMYGRSQRY